MSNVYICVSCDWMDAEKIAVEIAESHEYSDSFLSDVLLFIAVVKQDLLVRGNHTKFEFQLADISNFISIYNLNTTSYEVVEFITDMVNSSSKYHIEFMV